MNNSKLIHPAFSKRGATQPHNQKNVITYADRQRMYSTKYRESGRTINDVIAECNELNKFRGRCGLIPNSTK